MVISEIMNAPPSSTIIGWISAQNNEELHFTAVTLAEILYSIEQLPDGRRNELLRNTVIEVVEDFNERILPFDANLSCFTHKLLTFEIGLDRQLTASTNKLLQFAAHTVVSCPHEISKSPSISA